MQVLDVLLAAGDRWWSLYCDNTDCCPTAGNQRTTNPAEIADIAAKAGLTTHASREAAEQTLEPEPEHPGLAAALEAEERSHTLALITGADLSKLRDAYTAEIRHEVARRGVGDDRRLKPAQLARFGVALTDIPTRDAIWLAIDSRSIDAGPLLLELSRRLPAPYNAAPLFLYGWTHWREGNGVLAAIAAERALADAPYSAAKLLLAAVQQGLDPRTTPRISDGPEM